MLASLVVFWLVRASLAGPSNLAPIFAENIFARLWRTALTGPPSLGDTQGWPHYTQGAYNNTPQKNILPGTYVNTEASGWTSGFFPDALWQAYRRRTELIHREAFLGEPSPEEWLAMAEAWTEPLVTNINLTDTHDLGFLAKPFESAMQIQGNDHYLPVLQNMSLNLAARFEPGAGIIRSWDCVSGGQACSHKDSVLVIIDNMMVSNQLGPILKTCSNSPYPEPRPPRPLRINLHPQLHPPLHRHFPRRQNPPTPHPPRRLLLPRLRLQRHHRRSLPVPHRARPRRQQHLGSRASVGNLRLRGVLLPHRRREVLGSFAADGGLVHRAPAGGWAAVLGFRCRVCS